MRVEAPRGHEDHSWTQLRVNGVARRFFDVQIGFMSNKDLF